MKKPKLTFEQKALMVIEEIAANACLDQPIPLAEHPKDCLWCRIYMVAHAGRKPGCRKSHLSWEKELKETFKRYEKQ